jgi:hypothetical protein
MKIPKGMTEQQVIDQINLVCNRIAPRYTFYGYTVDDVEKRPLENFLSVNLSNRLKNFVRDHHFVGDDNPERQRVVQPAQLDFEDSIIDEEEKYSISYDSIEEQNMVNIIDQYLPAGLRMDYLKIINDIYVTKQRKDEIIDCINSLLQEYGYNTEDEE